MKPRPISQNYIQFSVLKNKKEENNQPEKVLVTDRIQNSWELISSEVISIKLAIGASIHFRWVKIANCYK